MAELNQQQVVEYIKGISVLEPSQLVKALETELGVSAAAAMPMAMAAGPGAAAAAPVEEKTEFNVILSDSQWQRRFKTCGQFWRRRGLAPLLYRRA